MGPAAATTAISVSLQDLLVSGSKDGSLLVVDVVAGRAVASLEKAHFTASKNPLSMLASRIVGGGGGGSGGGGAGQNHGSHPGHSGAGGHRVSGGGGRALPAYAVGSHITGVCCFDEGVLTSGMDGVVRFHPLALPDRE